MTITEKNAKDMTAADAPAEETAITTVEDAPASIEQVSKVEGFINTLDLNTDEGKLMTIRAYNAAESLNQRDNSKPFKLADIITIPGTRKSRQAGVPNEPCINAYLVDDHGNVFFTQSQGIVDSLQMIAALFFAGGAKPKEGFIEVTVDETTLPNGNTYKRLNPVL